MEDEIIYSIKHKNFEKWLSLISFSNPIMDLPDVKF